MSDSFQILTLSENPINRKFTTDGISNGMSQLYLLHILVMSSLFISTLLAIWDNILVDLAQDLHNTTEFLSLYTVCLVIIENRSIHSCASYINPTDNNLVVKQSSNTQF